MYPEALDAADKCVAINPNHPDPWFHKFMAYWANNDYDLAMDSAEIALDTRQNGELTVLHGNDPSLFEYKGPFDVARAYLSLGNIKRAYQLYDEVRKTAPEYVDEVSIPTGKRWNDIFEHAYKNLI
ncbi:hypothetical protein EON76_04590 [bacterium]|nr:MAG: hypothetical protein EON76_04590 [bacterium]